jgi:hypothetical protein
MNKILRIKNTNQLQLLDGSGCCYGMVREILFNMDAQNYLFRAILRRFRYSKGILILRKKDIGKVQITIDNLFDKNRIDCLKSGREYIFKLSN